MLKINSNSICLELEMVYSEIKFNRKYKKKIRDALLVIIKSKHLKGLEHFSKKDVSDWEKMMLFTSYLNTRYKFKESKEINLKNLKK